MGLFYRDPQGQNRAFLARLHSGFEQFEDPRPLRLCDIGISIIEEPLELHQRREPTRAGGKHVHRPFLCCE